MNDTKTVWPWPYVVRIRVHVSKHSNNQLTEYDDYCILRGHNSECSYTKRVFVYITKIWIKKKTILRLTHIICTGRKWHTRRKLLTPTFHFKILEDFLEVFNAQSKKLVRNLEDKAKGGPFNIFPFIALCTLDIICGEFKLQHIMTMYSQTVNWTLILFPFLLR